MESTTVEIPTPNIQYVTFTVKGLTPLLTHRMSEAAIEEMEGKQTKSAKSQQGKKKRDFDQEYEDSIYKLDNGGYGLPAMAFKKSMVRAGKLLGVVMKDAMVSFNVLDEFAEIVGKPEKRRDVVRVGQARVTRYRAQFRQWSTSIEFAYSARLISPEQLGNLLNQAGHTVGVGDYRPECSGRFGMFRIMEDEE